MKNLSLILALLIVVFTGPSARAMNNADIVVSIRPLHSLVANITEGISTPQLVLRTSSSPHTHALKPSQATALSQAKLIFWIGPQLETFLEKPLATLSRDATVISFLQTGKNPDPHIWLNPLIAKMMVKNIAATLTTADPQNAAIYKTNLQTTLARLDQLDRELAAKFTNPSPILVFHNAYSHLAERYGINIVGVLLHNPELAPGAKHIREIRQLVKTSKATCIFSESQFNRKIIDTVTSGTKIKTGTLDPLGSNLKAGPDQYFKMMRRLTKNLIECS